MIRSIRQHVIVSLVVSAFFLSGFAGSYGTADRQDVKTAVDLCFACDRLPGTSPELSTRSDPPGFAGMLLLAPLKNRQRVKRLTVFLPNLNPLDAPRDAWASLPLTTPRQAVQSFEAATLKSLRKVVLRH